MFHVIEKNEFDIYKRTNNIKDMSIKRYRRLPDERRKLKAEIQLIFKQITAIPNINIIGSIADINDLNIFVDKYDIHNCDFFDFWLIKYCNENNLCIVTDDGDFDNSFTTSNIYTANPQVV